MVTIYCIEDINNLKYVGSTTIKLSHRYVIHKYDKKHDNPCSSKLLDLENSKIYELEKCEESNRRERESHWINKFDTVNAFRLIYDNKKFVKQYYQDNKAECKKQVNNWKKKNPNYFKEYYKSKKQLYQYQNSWGGNKRSHNNLLSIDLSIFN